MMPCDELDKCAYTLGHIKSFVPMQLRNLLTSHFSKHIVQQVFAALLLCNCKIKQTCMIYIYGSHQQAMQLCCHATAEPSKHAGIMGHIRRFCAMQLRNLLTSHLSKHIVLQAYAAIIKQAMQLCYHVAVGSAFL